MKLKPTTSLNEAIKRMAAGDKGAASVIALLTKEFPDHAMAYLHALDGMGIYGADIWETYTKECGASVFTFIDKVSAWGQH